MSPVPFRARRLQRRVLVLFVVLGALVALLANALLRARTEPAPVPLAPAAVDAIHQAAATTPRSAAGPTEPGVESPVRTAVEAPPPPRLSFEERIAQLVALGARTAALAEAEDFAEAKRSDEEARREFADLLAAFADAGERALAALSVDAATAATAAADAPIDPLVAGRPMVLQLVVAAECQRRHAAALAAGDHARIDPFVQSILDVIPQATRLAEIAGEVLIDRPYLRACHETSVLSLAEFAGEGRVPRRIATRLLLTLWDNLQRTGERSSEELSRLAMLLLADADPTRRTAACRQLLRDGRYRAMMLAWLREQSDRAVAAEVAGLAAGELEPSVALQVLRELAPLLPRAPNAYMVLASRAPDVLVDAYQQLLATDTQPAVRSDLIAGLGFAASPRGRELADLALQNDPSPDVRIQAAFVMTATGAEDGERAMHRLLDDAAIARDPVRLGALVLAMQNLEAAGDVNALDRLARRLRGLPLADASREALAALVARSLPRSGTTGAAGPPADDPPAPR